jgi:DNA-binding response OmpR family regulator/DNA-binding CsgD family transcriptional regulator
MLDDQRPRDVILVVDDTPANLGFLTDMLDGAGFTVLVATDGDSALERLEHISVDLVLMDAVMPGMDGFETCRRLKALPQHTHLPVVFMTGLSETEHVVMGLQAGGVDYVTKPIVVDELLARIRVHLSNARAARASRVALDATGRHLLATDRSGRLLWCTPKAEQLLAVLRPAADSTALRLPEDLVERLNGLRTAAMPASLAISIGHQRLEFSFLSPTGPDEFLFRLSQTSAAGDEAALQQAFGLTLREAEVLLWLSRGKSNRDIGEILDISPRTVNKHLEQIFIKLGVENRAAATARAVRVLS